MSVVDAIVLGIVQGLTEFLPISSTAHLTFVGKAMGLISPEHPEEWTAFMAVIQLGTLCAVLAYYARDVVGIVSSFVEETLVARRPFAQLSRNARLGWFIIIGTVPVATLGLAIQKIIEGSLTKNLWVLAVNVIVFAVIMALAERVAKRERTADDVNWFDALIIGVAQAFALFPGASRSGTTISGGLFLGMTRAAAANFSFLLSIPAVFLSGVFELRKALGVLHGDQIGSLLVGTVVSGVVGYVAIWMLLRYLKEHSLRAFIWYRLALGAVIIGAIAAHLVEP
jgi:undecaprenyl-diphosphatase